MSDRTIRVADICAVVVTHFPEPACADNLRALASQVSQVLVIDNGSSALSLAPVEAAARNLGGSVMSLTTNRGIATALNAGLAFARERGYRWLATFDQDSLVTPNMIETMAQALAAYPQSHKVAVIAPCHVDRALGFAVREAAEATGPGWRVLRTTMSSGNLVDVRAATSAGGFDDSLFIDYVDHDFCLRLRRCGYQVLEATRAQLLHSLGVLERRRFIGLSVSITNHSAPRLYYISRNRLILWRRYWRREPRWVVRDVRRLLSETLFIVLYERQVGAKVRMIVRGVWHGVRDVRGPLRSRY
jgi:rhamnosyltransferase